MLGYICGVTDCDTSSALSAVYADEGAQLPCSIAAIHTPRDGKPIISLP
jgi:hypothetical protein